MRWKFGRDELGVRRGGVYREGYYGGRRLVERESGGELCTEV